MRGAQATSLLKADAFGRVERAVAADGSECVRRVACGGGFPGSRWIARRLLAREVRALGVLAGIPDVPRLLGSRRGMLERSWFEGEPLSRAQELPLDFFDRLDELVLALHARGVCHNDLHKEQNVLVRAGGRPALLDFQLASVHSGRSRLFASRTRDDLRHVEKHRRRYTRDGRGPAGPQPSRGVGHGLARSWTALVWRHAGKPACAFVTRRILGIREPEERRESSGPWPRWTEPIRHRANEPASISRS